MSIRRFLILIFMMMISIAIYLNVKYLDGITIEKNSKSIDNYVITEIWCHNSSKIDKGLIKPELYYMKAKDEVFYKGQYFPLVYVYLTYIAAFLLPLFGFWIYRKQLNNHYSTM